jgi:hypothetical protein
MAKINPGKVKLQGRKRDPERAGKFSWQEKKNPVRGFMAKLKMLREENFMSEKESWER